MGWYGVVMGHSRSVEIAPSTVTMPLPYTVSDIARYWSKIADLNLLHLYLALPLG